MKGLEAQEQRIVDEKALAFFGAITASVTHELNNVMAIIEQVNGLLEDLVAGAQGGRTIAPEKIANIRARITKQVDRGVAIIKRLNSFAHSADEPIRSCDLNVLLADLMALCERLAALRKQKLEFQAPAGAVMVRNSPYYVELATYLSLKLVMEAVPAEGVISLSLKEHEMGAQIVVFGSPASDLKDADGELADLTAAVKSFRGDFAKIQNAQGIRFELRVPQISSEEQ
jgi:C4-dicarboxylate-specific signal transduction histidine kinase